MTSRAEIAVRGVRAVGEIVARFEGARTRVAALREAGGLRLKFPKPHEGCEAVVVNTAGGVVGGDRARLSFTAGPGARATVTTQSSEKIYRSDGACAQVAVSLSLASGAELRWLPQETILFDQARLDRRLDVDLAPDASLLAAEMIVFGRLGMGEVAQAGRFVDQWRVRRGGRLVFAEATRFDGAFAETLDRPAVGAGARATATILRVAPDAAASLDALRAIAAAQPDVEAGFSAWDGRLVGRMAARDPARLRAALAAVLAPLMGAAPRVWR